MNGGNGLATGFGDPGSESNQGMLDLDSAALVLKKCASLPIVRNCVGILLFGLSRRPFSANEWGMQGGVEPVRRWPPGKRINEWCKLWVDSGI